MISEKKQKKKLKIFLDLLKKQEVSSKLGLKSEEEWETWIQNNKLPDIPINPDRFYKYNGWISWNNWLGLPDTTTTKI